MAVGVIGRRRDEGTATDNSRLRELVPCGIISISRRIAEGVNLLHQMARGVVREERRLPVRVGDRRLVPGSIVGVRGYPVTFS
jgi:hypothetical protein